MCSADRIAALEQQVADLTSQLSAATEAKERAEGEREEAVTCPECGSTMDIDDNVESCPLCTAEETASQTEAEYEQEITALEQHVAILGRNISEGIMALPPHTQLSWPSVDFTTGDGLASVIRMVTDAHADSVRQLATANECAETWRRTADEHFASLSAALLREMGLRQALVDAEPFVIMWATEYAQRYMGDKSISPPIEKWHEEHRKIYNKVHTALSTPGPTLAGIRAEAVREDELVKYLNGECGGENVGQTLIRFSRLVRAIAKDKKGRPDVLVEDWRSWLLELGQRINAHLIQINTDAGKQENADAR